MARTTPQVNDSLLVGSTDHPEGIVVGTAAWLAWLEAATSFTFVGPAGTFTARKEQGGAPAGIGRPTGARPESCIRPISASRTR